MPICVCVHVYVVSALYICLFYVYIDAVAVAIAVDDCLGIWIEGQNYAVCKPLSAKLNEKMKICRWFFPIVPKYKYTDKHTPGHKRIMPCNEIH